MGELFQKRLVEERYLHAVLLEEVYDAVALHGLLQDGGHALVQLGVAHATAAVSTFALDAEHLHAKHADERRLVLVLLGHQALAQGERLVHELCLLQQVLGQVRSRRVEQPVGALGDAACQLLLAAAEYALAVVEAIQQVAANLKLLAELRVRRRGDVHVTVVGLVAGGVVLHGPLERTGDADVVHDEAALLAGVDPVNTGDGLHQVVTLHGLEHVHSRQAGHVEAREPHVHDDGYLHRVVVALELALHVLLVRRAAADVEPLLGVLVAHGHDDADLVLPGGPHLHQPVVDLHRDGPAVGHDHCLAGQHVGAVRLVVIHDVGAERVDGLGRAEDGVHAAQLVLAALDAGGVCVLGVLRVDGVKLGKDALVQMKRNHAALVEDGARGVVLHGLRHVVHVDVVAEYLARVLVLGGDGRPREADVARVGKGLSHHAGRAYGHVAALVHALGQPVLPTVRLVHHHDHVAAVAQRLVAVHELLHRREYDAIGLAPDEQVLQVLAALGVHGLLAQESLAASELPVELVVQVVTVGDDHDGRAVQPLLQKVREEDHRERLARALRVPEHADLAIACHRLHGAVGRLAHREVLVVPSEYLHNALGRVVKADEVVHDVDEALLAEHAVEHRLPVGVRRSRVVAVHALPGDVAVLLGRNGAHARLGEVAHHAEGVRHEQAGDVLHVVAQLLVGVARVGLLARRALQLKHDERHAVHEHDDVGPLLGVLDEGPLVHHVEAVVQRVPVVQEVDDVVALLLAVVEVHLYARLQVVVEDLVLLVERARVDVGHLEDGLLDCHVGKAGVDALEARGQHHGEEHVAVVRRRPRHVRAVKELVAQVVAQVLDDDLLVEVLVDGHRDSHVLDGHLVVDHARHLLPVARSGKLLDHALLDERGEGEPRKRCGLLGRVAKAARDADGDGNQFRVHEKRLNLGRRSARLKQLRILHEPS